MEIAFSKHATDLSLHVLEQPAPDAHRSVLDGLDVGKGCIRCRRAEQIDWELVVALLAETSASDDGIC